MAEQSTTSFLFSSTLLYRYITSFPILLSYLFFDKSPFYGTPFFYIIVLYLIFNSLLHFYLSVKRSLPTSHILTLQETLFSPLTLFYGGGLSSPFVIIHLSVFFISRLSEETKQSFSLFFPVSLSLSFLLFGTVFHASSSPEFSRAGFGFLMIATILYIFLVTRRVTKNYRQELEHTQVLSNRLSLFCKHLFTCDSAEKVLLYITESLQLRLAVLGTISKSAHSFTTSTIVVNNTIEKNYTIPLSASLAELAIENDSSTPLDPNSARQKTDDPITSFFPVGFFLGIPLKDTDSEISNILIVANDIPPGSIDTVNLLLDKTAQYLKHFLDIAEEEAEKTLISQVQGTRKKMISLSHMAGRIAHDFNNVIGAIGGYSTLLKKKLGDDHPNIRYITNIINAASNGSEITNQLSLLIKSTQPIMDLIDIHSMISSTVTLLRDESDQNVTISTTFNARNYHIAGDSPLLQKIVFNLGRNSINACENRGGTIALSTANKIIDSENPLCSRFSIRPGHYIKITIRDTGSGIDAETAERMFDPYFTTQPKGKGDGLGLAYLWTYIETYHAAYELSTAPDEGTTLSLYFPIIYENSEYSTSTQSEKSRSPVKTLLIVDDEPSIREIYTDILSENGYDVHSVCDGSEVLPFLEKSPHPIDLILLDMVMPKMNGMETFKALRARYKDIPILLMSGLATSSSLSSLLDEPATAFFNKALDYNQLIEMIKSRF